MASLADQCSRVAGDPCHALWLAIKITRLQLIQQGEIEPMPHEELPDEVRDAVEERALALV